MTKRVKSPRVTDSKSMHRINLHLPEDLIEPTIDLLQDSSILEI